ARSLVVPAELRPPDLVAARTHLGLPRAAGGRARRDAVARHGHVPSPQRRLPRDRRHLPGRVRVRGAGAWEPAADVRNTLRVIFIGGLTSYRALFNWISPWIFIPHALGYPIFEILFFAYLGRFAGVQSDQFFLIGNAFLAIAVTGMFGMGHATAGERRSQTLAALLASPANRFAVFLGRALPSIVTGCFVATTSFTICAAILGVHVRLSSRPRSRERREHRQRLGPPAEGSLDRMRVPRPRPGDAEVLRVRGAENGLARDVLGLVATRHPGVRADADRIPGVDRDDQAHERR